MTLEALHLTELDHINNAIDIIPVSIYCKDLNGVYLKINQTAYEAMINCGYLSAASASDAIIGKTDFDLFSESIAARYRANDNETIRSQQVIYVEENIYLPDGDLLKQISTKKPLLNASGKVIGVLGTTVIVPEKNQAITAKKMLSNSLTKREKECLSLYLEGKTSKETAYILEISFRTVEWHMEQIKTKLNCPTKRDLLCFRDLI